MQSGKARKALGALTSWKALGLAGAVGVTATGVLAVRAERKRRSYTPDEVRARLHERAAEIAEQD